ncbi:MAG: YsnF/AvaK domain-containing protein [Chitinophagaceae bacterium]
MAQTVIGIFDNAEDAQEAVQQLVKNGISRDNIDVSARSSTLEGTTDSGKVTGTGNDTGYNTGNTSGSGLSGSSTDTDYTTGGSMGSGLNTGSPTNTGYSSGDTLNTGFNTGSSTNLGTGSTGLSSGSYNTSGTAGDRKESGISKFFKSLFGNDDDEVTRYSSVAERSGSIVTVHAQTSDEAEEAADILDDAGAIDVNEKASQYGSGNYSQKTGSNTGYNTSDLNTSDLNTTEGTTSIPIIEEQLEVRKRTVEKGGVRLKSRIVEREVEENLRLREERVWLERNSVDRPATEADFTNFKEGTVEVTEQSEVPVVNKQARVVEEVSLGKEVNEKEETVRGTVRKTEVDVENLDKTENRKGTTDTDDWSNSKSSL